MHNPVPPAHRSTGANTKASRKTTSDTHLPTHSYQGLLTHLSTLTRNQVHFAGTDNTVPMLAEATDAQVRAFQLLGATITLTLKYTKQATDKQGTPSSTLHPSFSTRQL